jgi:hypothetical protein
MARDLESGVVTEIQEDLYRPVWIVRLDIDRDPVLAWTGRGDLVVAADQTGDAALDGNTFVGLGNIGKIGEITDTEKGSNAVRLILPGADLTDTALQQVVMDNRRWQNRQAWIWFGVLDTSLNVIADPARVKTGRMDAMTVLGSGTEGSVSAVIESHQTYASIPLNTRYSQQKDEIDSADVSQDYAHDLANRQPGIGEETKVGSYPVGGYSRFSGENFQTRMY